MKSKDVNILINSLIEQKKLAQEMTDLSRYYLDKAIDIYEGEKRKLEAIDDRLKVLGQ